MTAPISLREYFATTGSRFTKQDAEVIGPQLEEMAEQAEVSQRNIVDTAKSDNSPLHRFFDWDDASAADKHRLDEANKMMRSIRVRYLEDNRPRTSPAYKIARTQPKSTFGRGHNVLHGESAAAVQKAKDAFDELTSWRARYAPYVVVWTDFARAFRGVANQISEAEDVVRAGTLDDATDEALTDLVGHIHGLNEWQRQHGSVGQAWSDLAEQAGFIVEAVDGAIGVFTKDLKAAERKCLRCGSTFQSGGAGNRLCEKCATKAA